MMWGSTPAKRSNHAGPVPPERALDRRVSDGRETCAPPESHATDLLLMRSVGVGGVRVRRVLVPLLNEVLDTPDSG